jgi:hypothetical protein
MSAELVILALCEAPPSDYRHLYIDFLTLKDTRLHEASYPEDFLSATSCSSRLIGPWLPPPRPHHLISRHRRRRGLCRLQQLAPYQPAHARLRSALRNADRIGNRLIAGVNTLPADAPGLKSEPEIDQKTGRLMVVADQVAHQDVHNIVVDGH